MAKPPRLKARLPQLILTFLALSVLIQGYLVTNASAGPWSVAGSGGIELKVDPLFFEDSDLLGITFFSERLPETLPEQVSATVQAPDGLEFDCTQVTSFSAITYGEQDQNWKSLGKNSGCKSTEIRFEMNEYSDGWELLPTHRLLLFVSGILLEADREYAVKAEWDDGTKNVTKYSSDVLGSKSYERAKPVVLEGGSSVVESGNSSALMQDTPEDFSDAVATRWRLVNVRLGDSSPATPLHAAYYSPTDTEIDCASVTVEVDDVSLDDSDYSCNEVTVSIYERVLRSSGPRATIEVNASLRFETVGSQPVQGRAIFVDGAGVLRVFEVVTQKDNLDASSPEPGSEENPPKEESISGISILGIVVAVAAVATCVGFLNRRHKRANLY